MNEKNLPEENDKITKILLKVRVPVLSLLGAAVLIALVYSVVSGVQKSKSEKLANQLDLLVEKIEKNYDDLKLVKEEPEKTENNDEAESSEAVAAETQEAQETPEKKPLREDEKITLEESYAELQKIADEAKTGNIAARALVAKGDIYFSREEWQSAKDAYLSASAANPDTYLAGIALFGAASACDELGEADNAAENYKKAAEQRDFLLASHALFNAGRVLDTAGKHADAAKIFEELNEKFPDNNWADIGKSRLLSMKAEGLVE